MSRRTVTLKVELPTELAELLARNGDDLLRAFETLIRASKQASDAGEIAEISRRLEAKADARRAFVVSLGRQAHRFYRSRLKRKPQGLLPTDQANWRDRMQAEIAAEIGHPKELVDVALRQHRQFMKGRIHARRMLYALRAELKGESRRSISRRFGIGITTISGLLNQADERAATKGVSLSEYERHLTAKRLEEIRTSTASSSDSEAIIDLRAVMITREGKP